MTTTERLMKVMRAEYANMERLHIMYEANSKLFDAYSLANDAQQMANTRETLHGLLDSILDSSSIVLNAKRQLGEIT